MSTNALAVAVLLPLAGLAAQTNVLQQRIDAAIAGLGVEATALDSSLALQNLGAAAVPALRALLAQPQAAGDAEQKVARRRNALYVLGRLGAVAVAATPEVLAIVRRRDAALGRQAEWALGQIGPFASEPLRADCSEGLRTGSDEFVGRVAATRLWLGAAPKPAVLLDCLRSRDPAARVASAQAMAAAGGWTEEQHGELLAAASQLLATELERHPFPWDDTEVLAAPYLASQQSPTQSLDGRPDLARALLRHLDPFQRQRALVALRTARPVSCRERADVLPLLWDNTPQVRASALATVQAWGTLETLASLLAIARAPGDELHRQACATAADELRAAVVATQPGNAVEALLQAVAGAEVMATPRNGPAPPGTDAAFVDLLAGAEWCDDDSAARLLATAETLGLFGGRAIHAVLRLLSNSRADTRSAAAAWLCRRGVLVSRAVPELTADLVKLAQHWNQRPVLAMVVECHALAHAGSNASADELLAALPSDSPRLVARAACELAQRGQEAVQPCLEALRAAVHSWRCTTLTGRDGAVIYLKPDLTAETVAAVALARAVAGDGPWDHGELVAFAAEWRGVAPDAAAAWLLQQAPVPAVGDLAQAIEAAMVRKLAAAAALSQRPQ